jgi:hypothetical protein
MDNRTYVKRITLTILLTNIPAILSLPWFWKVGIGWIAGSLASAANFLWLAHNVKQSLDLQPSKSKLNAVKGTYLRLLSLLFYTVLIMSFLKPNIIIFGFGLLSAQIVIYLFELVSSTKRSKYLRGSDG